MAESTNLKYVVNVDLAGSADAEAGLRRVQDLLNEIYELEQKVNKGINSRSFGKVTEAHNEMFYKQAQLRKEANVTMSRLSSKRDQEARMGNTGPALEAQKRLDRVESQVRNVSQKIQRTQTSNNAKLTSSGKGQYVTQGNYGNKASNSTKEVTDLEEIRIQAKKNYRMINDDIQEFTGLSKIAMKTKMVNAAQGNRIRSSYESLNRVVDKDQHKKTIQEIEKGNFTVADIQNMEDPDGEKTTNAMEKLSVLKELSQKAVRERESSLEMSGEYNIPRRRGDVKLAETNLDNYKESGGKNEKIIAKLENTLKDAQNNLKIEEDLAKSEDAELQEANKLLDMINNNIKDLTARIAEAQDLRDEMIGTNGSDGKVAKPGMNIKETPHRNTIEGRMIERSFAISLATLLAVVGSVKNTYSRGNSVWDSMGDSSQSVGIRTGNNDYTALREESQRSGLDVGRSGADMLAISDAIIKSNGTTNPQDLTEMTRSLAEFSQYSGASQDVTGNLMSSIYKDSQLSSTFDSKEIQEAIVGGILASGLQGREDEQLNALNGIIHETIKGREASAEEVKKIVAMSNYVSAKGGKAFQGENLERFMGTMSSEIKNASPYSTTALLMGVGSDPKYANGVDGRYEYLKDREGGASPENMSAIMGNMYAIAGGDSKKAAVLMTEQYDTGVGVEQMKEFFDETQGQFSTEDLSKFMDSTKAEGASKMAENKDSWEGSADFHRSMASLTKEISDLKVADNDMIESMNKLRTSINNWAGENAGRATTGAILKGLSTGIATFAGSALSAGMVQLMTGGLIKGFTFGGAAAATTAAATGTAATAAATGVSATGAVAGGGLLAGMGAGAAKFLSKLGGAGGALGKAGTVGLAISGGLDVMDFATSEDKLQTGTEKLGKWGGVAAGAQAGGALGTVILPGIGTAVGTAIGAVLGGFGGQKLGEETGKIFTGIRDRKKEPNITSPEIGPEISRGAEDLQQRSDEFEEKDITNQQYTTQEKKSSNLGTEREIVAQQDALLRYADRLLVQAKAQNGIMGVMDTASSGLDGGGGLGGLGTVGNGKFWTNTDLTRHDLAKTTSTLTPDDLNKWINANTNSSSTMHNTGQAFYDAGKESGMDPRYLVSHAALETGWGTSSYSKAGNFYGIGAFDDNPDNALKYGNNSSRQGIIEGAKWISENYYNKGQTTLDSMRNNGGVHEYATDPQWATKIAATMKGSEKYTNPSVNINTTVNYTGNGGAEGVANAVSSRIASTIPQVFTREYTRLRA